ncbi:co-chaperone YbbN [Nocardia sp. 852002-20019_SCH5090214]|jgi:putative thioredoxin|uniref:Co-chaperone YbbN n=1 Tax=Nocardia nova TaxID=37330 RepID=A0A2S5ZWY5_9NOCA|nr:MULTISPECIES: tetratricopeptide repeat protein [Nocardia]OBF87076.1 co-chaperone YbbN [Mycobacterium sp. 852002-51759_SCH5129042]MBF6276598.1 tetratricopeptide repeat protein [Nocardia nova]MBV7707486.1 tetratricopeptide repeat protein [Nocardia nova]OBA45215.1 co-chaperone YbbN [Nocardia sp. 852002-51101_SCH5132738]OBA61253.1 co-chaperone YbbN [Nocardia sp. 852002-20019_SCH5090214]
MSGAVDLSALKQPAATDVPGDHAVTEADFETKVLRRSLEVPVVVVLYSQRSPGSVELVKLFERLVGSAGGSWELATIEAEPNMRIAQAFGVQGIPTVIAVAAGQPLADFQGSQPEEQVKQWLAAVVDAVRGKLPGAGDDQGQAPVPEDPRFVAAEEALDRGDIAGAEAAYEAILAAEPANEEAKAALRQVRFFGRARELPADAIAVADADPGNIDAAFTAADAELFNQQPEAAFDRLIGLIKRTAGDDRNRVRTRLVELFELFDTADPVVVAARRKLATALY